MQLFNRYVSPRGLTVFGCEILLIFGSVAIAARAHGAGADVVHDIWKIALITGLCQLCFYYNDLYDLTVVHSSRELLIRLLQAAGAATILVALLYLLIPEIALGNRIFVSSLVIFLIAIIAWRLLSNRLAYASHLEERVLIVGTGATARMVARQIQSQHDFGYRVIGYIDDSPTRGTGVLNPATLGGAEEIPRIVEQYDVDRIVVGLSDRRGRLPISELLQAKLSGVRVEDATTTYERLTGKILIDVTAPLVPPKVTKVQLPSAGSAAQEAKEIVGEGVEVVAAFQTISHELLLTEEEVDCDVLVTGTSKQARQEALKLVEAAGLTGWDAGPIENSVVVEGLSNVLININKQYGSTHAGIKITGAMKK